MDILNKIGWVEYVNDVPTQYEKFEFQGLSTEADPVWLTTVNRGSTYVKTDTGDSYIWTGTAWKAVNAQLDATFAEYTVGNLPELDTDTRDTTVAAINEVYWDARPTHYNRTVVFESDFMDPTAPVPGLAIGALFSGVFQSEGTLTTSEHPGVCGIYDSTTNNGGYKVMSNIGALLLKGCETSEFVFSLGAGAARTTASVRMGFQDSAAVQTAPTDGVWIDIVGNGTKATLTGKTSSNSTVSTTAVPITLELSTWYRGTITVNSDATSVNFQIRTCADGLGIGGGDLTTNIPTGAGRTTGWGIIAGETTTDAGALILAIDYANMSIDRTLVR